MGTSARWQPRLHPIRQSAEERYAGQSVGHTRPLPDRRKLRRNSGNNRNAYAEPYGLYTPASRPTRRMERGTRGRNMRKGRIRR